MPLRTPLEQHLIHAEPLYEHFCVNKAHLTPVFRAWDHCMIVFANAIKIQCLIMMKSNYVKIMPLTRSLECEWTNNHPFQTTYLILWIESSSVLYISPTDTSSMQNLILQGLQQKLQISCSRFNKNARHVESGYILQPHNYLLLFVNRFRYIDNNVTKDRCSIPMDTTVILGPLKFSLRATIDHHGPSIHSGHYTASINCCKKKKKTTFYCNDHTITEFGIIDSKYSSTAYVILYKLIDTWFLDSNRRVGVWSLPWRWHILSIPLTTGRGTSAETCGLDDVFPPDDLCSRPEALC